MTEQVATLVASGSSNEGVIVDYTSAIITAAVWGKSAARKDVA
jgi:hypothetical protein